MKGTLREVETDVRCVKLLDGEFWVVEVSTDCWLKSKWCFVEGAGVSRNPAKAMAYALAELSENILKEAMK